MSDPAGGPERSEEPADDVLPDEDERTVIVDRGVDDDDERTVIVDRGVDDDDERTVIVDRGFDDDDERTVIVDREAHDAQDGERTVVVDRPVESSHPAEGADTAKPDAHDRPDEHDGTVVVDRSVGEFEQPLFRPPAPPREKQPLGGRGRRALRPAPLDPTLVRTATDAPGPGAVDPYAPRSVPEPTAPPAELAPTASATRVVDGSLPSVETDARRVSLIAVGAVIGAVVVSVAGLGVLLALLLG